jgi:phage terminase small subunit
MAEPRKTKLRTAKLSESQRLFVEYLLADEKMDKTQAAIKAGYSKKTAASMGCQMAQKPHIMEYMEQRIAERQKRLEIEIDQDYVLKSLVETLEMAKGVRPTIVTRTDSDGRQRKVNVHKSNLQAANRSIELLGKHLNMFKDHQEITHTNSLEKTIREISEENAASRKSLLPKDNIDFDSEAE